MFESTQLRHAVSKAAYQREQAQLRADLLNAQFDLKLDGRFPVLILIAGVEGAGKGEEEAKGAKGAKRSKGDKAGKSGKSGTRKAKG